jgi:hypothetical protein
MRAAKPKEIIPEDDVIEARRAAEDELSLPWTAVSIEYHPVGDGFALHMLSGITLSVPRILIDEFDAIPVSLLARAKVGIGGDSIVLKDHDIHIALAGLLRDIFGLNSSQRASGRARSVAKSNAAKRNGARPGRPRNLR